MPEAYCSAAVCGSSRMLVCVKCVKQLLLFFLFECMHVGVFVIFVHVSAGSTVEEQVVLQVLH